MFLGLLSLCIIIYEGLIQQGVSVHWECLTLQHSQVLWFRQNKVLDVIPVLILPIYYNHWTLIRSRIGLDPSFLNVPIYCWLATLRCTTHLKITLLLLWVSTSDSKQFGCRTSLPCLQLFLLSFSFPVTHKLFVIKYNEANANRKKWNELHSQVFSHIGMVFKCFYFCKMHSLRTGISQLQN